MVLKERGSVKHSHARKRSRRGKRGGVLPTKSAHFLIRLVTSAATFHAHPVNSLWILVIGASLDFWV